MGATPLKKPVPKAKITEVSPRVAAAYATLDKKTLTRDIAWLESQRMIRNEGDGYVANREVILAFLPKVIITGELVTDSNATVLPSEQSASPDLE